MQFFFKTQEKNLKQNFKAFKQEIFFTKKNLNLKKKSNKFCEKPKEKICFLPLCDFLKLFFFTFFEKNIE